MSESTPKREVAGSVLAQSQLTNTLAGNIVSISVPTNMAINGQGFFTVVQKTGDANGAATFGGTNLYTRRGDFSQDKDGYLVNGAGGYLTGSQPRSDHGPDDQHRADQAREHVASGPGDDDDHLRGQSARDAQHVSLLGVGLGLYDRMTSRRAQRYRRRRSVKVDSTQAGCRRDLREQQHRGPDADRLHVDRRAGNARRPAGPRFRMRSIDAGPAG